MWAEQIWAVVRKDLLLEARGRTNLSAMIFVSVQVLLLFSFALGPSSDRLRASAGGLLWLAFIFAGILAFGRAYQIEAENDSFEGLLLVARSRSAIYLGKVIGVACVMFVIEAFTVPLMAILYNLSLWTDILRLIPIALLGTLGFASVGALYGALTMSLRAREVLLPLLLLPVSVPVVLCAVKATTAVLDPHGGEIARWLELLCAFDVVFVTAGMLTFEFVVGEE
jgi:heme exporter protein B